MDKKQQQRETGVFKYLPDVRDLCKFAAYGFMYKGFASFMNYQVRSLDSKSSIRDRIWGGLIAAGRGGLVGAFQLPVYVRMENALVVSHRDKSCTRFFFSSAALLWGSSILFRNVPYIPSAVSGPENSVFLTHVQRYLRRRRAEARCAAKLN